MDNLVEGFVVTTCIGMTLLPEKLSVLAQKIRLPLHAINAQVAYQYLGMQYTTSLVFISIDRGCIFAP